MSLINVHSSSIAAVGYEAGTLAVLFHTSDTLYLHPRVPYSVFAGLMSASSKGRFYNNYIRGKYK
jgi:hypothetical protein